jgi:hypothetical protein
MKKYWLTQNKEEIEYKKIEDRHLLNILNWIKKRAETGMTIETGGCGPEADDYWYDCWDIEGAEVLDRFDYKGLLKEAKKRKLII